jgi:hypothetical protein
VTPRMMRKSRLVITIFLLAFAPCPARGRIAFSGDRDNHSSKPFADNQSVSIIISQEPTKETTIGSIADTVANLHRIKANDVDVSPEARGLLTYFKHQLRDLISEIINDRNQSVPAKNLRAKIWDQLTAKGVTIGQPREHSIREYEWESKYDYGDLYDIRVSKPAGHPELLAVTTTIEIPCGRDSSFYLFHEFRSVWRLILTQEANGYSDVSGAQGLFDYRISFDSAKSFFVVTVNVNPWCTSAWQTIRYAVLRPGLRADNPHVILNGKETIYLGVDPPPYKLVVKRKSFSIRFAGEANRAQIMAGTITRDRVIRYRIHGSRPVRTPH